MLRILSSVALTAAIFAPQAEAQVRPGEFGFAVASSTSRGGNFCGGFTCTPSPMSAGQGDTLTMTVRTELRQPFIIAVARNIGRCTPVPRIGNQLILDPNTASTVAVGIVSNPSPILACWSGFEEVRVQLPRLPSPTTFYLQALTAGPSRGGGNAPAFTVAVACTVR